MSWWPPEDLPAGRFQAGDRHLKFHKTGDKLAQAGSSCTITLPR
jgi:hypothetical protein